MEVHARSHAAQAAQRTGWLIAAKDRKFQLLDEEERYPAIWAMNTIWIIGRRPKILGYCISNLSKASYLTLLGYDKPYNERNDDASHHHWSDTSFHDLRVIAGKFEHIGGTENVKACNVKERKCRACNVRNDRVDKVGTCQCHAGGSV